MPQLLKPSLDNSCSLLRMLVTVDSKPTRLSEQSIMTLGPCLSEYIMDAVQVITDYTFSNLFTDQKYLLDFMLSSIISHASFNFLDVPVHVLS